MAQDINGGASEVAVVKSADPDYITYLLDPEQEYNCYFVVGNPTLGKTEKIGVVKKMLLAHSLVLRAELQDSKIAEKNDVKVTDIFPDTFKNLLRFVYGYNNTETLSFDEADNLLYAAEKYMISKLKNTLATHLISMLDYSNICVLMNNPACYTVMELNSAITDILQMETDDVLASPEFLNLSPYGFQKILEQKICNVAEIELWRAAIQWAKKQGKSKDGVTLRNALNDHLQLIRVCSMSNDSILTEVVPTEILSYDEVMLVGKTRKTGKIHPNLTTICNVIKERDRPLSELLEQSLRKNESQYSNQRIVESTVKLTTRYDAIQLCSVQLYTGGISSHQCNCTVSIEKDTEPPIVVRYEGQVNQGSRWSIPTLIHGRPVRLRPNSSYAVRLRFSCSHTHYGLYRPSGPNSESGNQFSIDFQVHSVGYCIFHVDSFCYKTVITKRKKTAQSAQ